MNNLRQLLSAPAFRLTNDDAVWVWRKADPSGDQMSGEEQASAVVEHVLAQDIHANFSDLSEKIGAGRGELVNQVNSAVDRLWELVNIPEVMFIPASRRLTVSDESHGYEIPTFDGNQLIPRLGALQAPVLENHDENRKRFEDIERFVQNVTGDDTAKLLVPFDAKEINVRQNGLLLPLTSLGTGISQVVILAAAATIETNKLLCIEEPEVHLHPILQRKLLDYLNRYTNNQYLIATHSAHLLDAGSAQIFHTTLDDEGTKVAPAGTSHRLVEICSDLGYRPSDLLQANAVVWVEGPSDWIYLRRWIEFVAPDLVEGIHYSIMFYGGSLLFHLSSDDCLVEEFISLRRLNRQMVVLFDSDKKPDKQTINDTKQRVVNELRDSPGIAWVTEGRTIENYVPPILLEKVRKDMYSHDFDSCESQWSAVFHQRNTTKQSKIDKVAVAKQVVKHWCSGLDYLDLHSRIVEVVGLIGRANGLGEHPIEPKQPFWVE